MALVDPYALCPCGSGQKFKWCCIKVEPYAERAKRLLESGQLDGALAVIEEGLSKAADNPWLMTQKAITQVDLGHLDDAKATLTRLLELQPGHRSGSTLLTRLVLETESVAKGVLQFQSVLRNTPRDGRAGLGLLANFVGFYLHKAGQTPAALKHLELMKALSAGEQDHSQGIVKILESSATATPWEKNPYRLADAPEGLPEPVRETFDRAVGLADQGLWADAASLFQDLATAGAVGPVADRNLGLCRLWLADVAGAVEALRRYVVKAPPSVDSVDVEALCQNIAEPVAGQQVEFVQLSWPLRDRDGLIESLKQHAKVDYSGSRPSDPDDDDSPPVEQFVLLDRPRIDAGSSLTPNDVPFVLGTVLVAADAVRLEAHDDGRLDELTDRFTTLASRSIPPAHPKTKVLAKHDQTELALSWNWALPADLDEDEAERLNREQGARMIREVWPDTPMPYLHRRTPRQVAGHPNAEVPLRAAVLHYQVSSREMAALIDWDALRGELKIPAEPKFDPAALDVEQIHLARLEQVPCEELDDARLEALYLRANRYGLDQALYLAGLAIAARPGFCSRNRVPEAKLFGDLALRAARDDKREEAFEWLRRGRDEEPAATRAILAPVWDMHELQVRMMFDQPEEWVPDLAVILERYIDNPTASQIVNSRLLNLGLLRMVNDPDRPRETLVDPSPLQYLLKRFGPRITTSSGYLGVSATKGDIWTPGAASGGSTLWTPGSDAANPTAAADRPRVILPGQ